ncbi:hypothetical protein NE237_032153 [Protea cynaroides]|uniref:Uncharacterized protein n=1 Tax=Protea cynaroides TaxID=273540 RepID=A0A9Q0L3H1_9MAGN|nr:hypothetical protein NE237_032153 [Protea cynaroides]
MEPDSFGLHSSNCSAPRPANPICQPESVITHTTNDITLDSQPNPESKNPHPEAFPPLPNHKKPTLNTPLTSSETNPWFAPKSAAPKPQQRSLVFGRNSSSLCCPSVEKIPS